MDELTRENGFLKRGAVKCPDCKVSLHWELKCGIRLYRERQGKDFYKARCPTCYTTWMVCK